MRLVLSLTLIILSSFPMPNRVLCDELNRLKEQMQKIKEENAFSQEQLDRQRKIMEHLSEKIEMLEHKDQVLSEEVKDLEEKPTELALESEAEFSELKGIPELRIHGFSDIGFSAKFTDNESSTAFAIGAVDFLISSKITHRLSLIAEPNFHPNVDMNSSHFHLERVNLRYSLSDLFNIKIGRLHTALGYWNQAYHHGTWLQTTVFRPEIYLFEEDAGGFLPVHSVGIELLGTKEFEAFDLQYNFGVFNGRGKTREEIQNFKDGNDAKAINVLLSVAPYFADGLKLGVNIYNDRIPPNASVLDGGNGTDELIIGGHVTYIQPEVKLLGEIFNIQHDDKRHSNDFDTLGFYLQGEYKVDKFTPYYRFDFIDFEEGDAFFTPDAFDINKHTLGLKWDIFPWNSLKFEYSLSDKENTDDEHSLTANSSFTF